MPNVVLGVTGSVAAYRAADLARELMRAGCTVRACLSDAAERFLTPLLFESLTGQPCLMSAFDEPVQGRMAHIDWAREADLMIIAPATANTINKLAQGEGSDMLTTLALAYEGPMLIAPAMNPAMYAQESVQESIATLDCRGAVFVEPTEGDVACGEHGQGKLASIVRIAEEALALLSRNELLKGKKVLITSGPTREPIDDVRFLSNRSSGKMGAALAKVALLMGAEVTVVTGPAAAQIPRLAQVHRVSTALEMLERAKASATDADLIIGVAAVADYRPEQPIQGKRRHTDEAWDLRLVPNPDIIGELAKMAKSGAKVVGFAAEPGPDAAAAKDKLTRKGLFALAVNDISRTDVGFGADDNELRILFADGREMLSGKRSKLACALWLLAHLTG